MRRWMIVLLVVPLLLSGAPSRAQSVVATAASVITFERGEPASLWWDTATDTLFIADNEDNQIWSWTDRDGLRKAAVTPDATHAARAGSVGQIARLRDGRL